LKKRRLIIAVIILAAVLALSAAAIPLMRQSKAIRTAKSLPPYILEAVLAYNDLISPGEVTWEMLEDVTSLRFMYDKSVIVSVNGSKFGTNTGPYILPNRMERLYLAQLPEGYWQNLFSAFYADSEDPDPERQRIFQAWIPTIAPEAVTQPMYIFYPSASSRERSLISNLITTYVFTEGEIVAERTLDLSALSAFPNLESVEYFIDTDFVREYSSKDAYLAECGLTFENCPVELVVTEDVLFDRKLYQSLFRQLHDLP